MKGLLIVLLILFSLNAFSIGSDSCSYYKNQNDSLKTELILSNYKIEKVRFYLNITIKKPSQTKFLKGWIKRAIE